MPVEFRYRVIVNGTQLGDERVAQLPDAPDPRIEELRLINAAQGEQLIRAHAKIRELSRRRWWWPF